MGPAYVLANEGPVNTKHSVGCARLAVLHSLNGTHVHEKNKDALLGLAIFGLNEELPLMATVPSEPMETVGLVFCPPIRAINGCDTTAMDRDTAVHSGGE